MSSVRGKVLVIDDKETMLRLLERLLGEHHDVTTANDGAKALALLSAQHFDLILTDIRMPGADGFEVVKFVKEKHPDTEVVMMTAYASVEAAVEAIKQGAYDYLQKPFDPDDVVLVVARALERRSLQAQAPELGTQLPGQAAHSGPEDLPLEEASAAGDENTLLERSYRDVVNLAREKVSREYLTALMRRFQGNVTQAASRAGLERESLHRLLKQYDVRADSFREGADGSGNRGKAGTTDPKDRP
jgi:DNA-binding NtrC family response regulator